MAKREEPRPEMVARMARYLGCSGTHKGPNGELMPCSSHEELMRISDRAEPKKKKTDDPKKKKRRRVGRNVAGYEPLGERGVISIDSLPGGGLVSGKADSNDYFEAYELLELKAANYTKPELRERIKKRIMAGSRGGKPGQWSARKAQLLALEYRRAGGGYRGGRKKPQRSLDKWTREDWTTSDDKPAIREGGTNRYLPRSAWEKLTPAQRAATNRKKRRGSRTGRQFVANTERAREAGRRARQSEKSFLSGRAKPRVGDPDVFLNPDAARLRSRQLGCIGISRRQAADGTTVWMPCTNMSDYRRRMGVGPQARRDRERAERRLVGRLRRRKSGEDCGCSDVDGFLFGAFGGEEKGIGKKIRRRVGAGRKKPTLSRVAFDANADDADGDGIVQEGTIHQRVLKPKKPAEKPKKLRNEVLARDFGSGGKKKKKPKLSAAEMNRLIAQSEGPKPEKPDSVPSVSRVRQLFSDRAERLSKEFGEVKTRSQATQALSKAFPNADIKFILDDDLTPGQRGVVHTLLDMSISHPETAKNLRAIGDARPGTPEKQKFQNIRNADASHFFDYEVDKWEDENLLEWRQELWVNGSIKDVLLKNRSSVRREAKQGANTTGLTYIVKRESDDLNNDDLDELYASYLLAHEFGHAWHYSSMRTAELESPDALTQVRAYYDIPDSEIDKKYKEMYDDLFSKSPNEDPAILRQKAGLALFSALNQELEKDNINAVRNRTLRDGLPSGTYNSLPADSKRISRYAGVSPREAVAEEFAVEYILKDYQNVTRGRSIAMTRLLEEMSKKKSDDSTDWKKIMAAIKPSKALSYLKGMPSFTETTCEEFHP